MLVVAHLAHMQPRLNEMTENYLCEFGVPAKCASEPSCITVSEGRNSSARA